MIDGELTPEQKTELYGLLVREADNDDKFVKNLRASSAVQAECSQNR
jgi:hypothetical protein